MLWLRVVGTHVQAELEALAPGAGLPPQEALDQPRAAPPNWARALPGVGGRRCSACRQGWVSGCMG